MRVLSGYLIGTTGANNWLTGVLRAPGVAPRCLLLGLDELALGSPESDYRIGTTKRSTAITCSPTCADAAVQLVQGRLAPTRQELGSMYLPKGGSYPEPAAGRDLASFDREGAGEEAPEEGVAEGVIMRTIAVLLLGLVGCESTYRFQPQPWATTSYEQAKAQCTYETQKETGGTSMLVCLEAKGWKGTPVE